MVAEGGRLGRAADADAVARRRRKPSPAAASSKSVAPDDDEDSEGEDDDEVSELRSDRASVAAGGAFSFHVGKKSTAPTTSRCSRSWGRAFGKVMPKAKDSGTIYAMKSLSKAVLMSATRSCTKTERKALELHHPFLVHLRSRSRRRRSCTS